MNSLAIGHSKKHRQSQPFVSWLSEAVVKSGNEGPHSHQKEIDNLLARRRAFRRGVELDRTFGLDNYDIHARQYFAMAPMWDRIDSLAEKYYSISPYAYCGGDPVNLGDYDGKQFITFMGTSNPIMLGTSEVIVSGRTPILGTADKVSTLGRSASESQNSKLLHPEQNHHIIPRQAAKLKQTKVARKEGFKVDGRENKISVSRFSRQDGKGQHGNHPNYNKQILDELRNMTEEKGGPSLAEQFRNLVEKIRHIIMENPKTKSTILN